MNIESGNVLNKAPRNRINPYLEAAVLVARRLRWDIIPLSWKSRKKIKKWRNQYQGKKAIILCNGPSLNKVDFELLDNASIFTFGLNKINLLFDKTDFRPSCIVAVNKLVMEQNRDFYNTTELPLFLQDIGKKWIKNRKNTCFLNACSIPKLFARDCSMSINLGSTVTYVAMQLAFHMGFSNIALVGCDHDFNTKGPGGKKTKAEGEDQNHFDSRYFSDGVQWHLPDLAASEMHYEIAKNVYKHYGKKIFNCTEGGKLEIFERMSLLDFINNV